MMPSYRTTGTQSAQQPSASLSSGSRAYSGPSASDIAHRLPGSSQRVDAKGWWTLLGWCHGSGEKRGSTSLRVADRDGGGISVTCFRACTRETIIRALEAATGWRIWEAYSSAPHRFPTSHSKPSAPAPSTQATPARTSPDMTGIASGTWAATTPIPLAPDHPARLWAAARHLWHPDLPLPGPIRWLPADAHWQGRGRHTGAGSVVALVAPPAAWMAAWPGLPPPQAVQIIAVTARGEPALDRPRDRGGLGKRSVGPTAGGVVVLGCPDLTDSLEPTRVAEGVADGVALASRNAGAAVCTLGTSGMQGGGLVLWLATCPAGVVIHVDADAGGSEVGRQLRRDLQDAGVTVSAVLPASGKDAAEAAAAQPFGPLPDGWITYAETLRDTTSWPRWEIARASVTTLMQTEVVS